MTRRSLRDDRSPSTVMTCTLRHDVSRRSHHALISITQVPTTGVVASELCVSVLRTGVLY